MDIELIKGSEEYNLYSLDSLVAKTIGDKPTYYISQANGSDIVQVKIDSFTTEEKYLIGVNSKWDAQTRTLETIGENVWTIDMDFDGIKEILKLIPYEENNEKKVKLLIENSSDSIIVFDDILDGTYARELKFFVLDLNGDGKMEIVTALVGHNISVDVIEYKDSKISTVLGFYDGD